MAIRDPYVAQVHLCSTLVFFFLIHGLIGLFNKRKAATNNIQAFHLIFMVPLSLATGMWLQHVLFADHVELCLVILNTEVNILVYISSVFIMFIFLSKILAWVLFFLTTALEVAVWAGGEYWAEHWHDGVEYVVLPLFILGCYHSLYNGMWAFITGNKAAFNLVGTFILIAAVIVVLPILMFEVVVENFYVPIVCLGVTPTVGLFLVFPLYNKADPSLAWESVQTHYIVTDKDGVDHACIVGAKTADNEVVDVGEEQDESRSDEDEDEEDESDANDRRPRRKARA